MDFERKDGGPPPAHSNYDPSYVAAFYDRDPESEWLRLVRSPLEEIKLHIHEHYLRKYMTSEMRVLEIGAGPGRFTKTLHELGCSVVVGDISAKQLEANKEKARELGFGASVERWIQMDICDMAAIDSGAFDAVVAYGGPISYVFDRAGDAIRECARVVRPGGLLLASVMSLWGTMLAHFDAIVQVPAEINRAIVRTGDLSPDTDPGTGHYCHLYRAAELQNLVESGGFRVIAMSASNALASKNPDVLVGVRNDPAHWEALLEWELEASASPGLVEAGTHIIVVAEKGV